MAEFGLIKIQGKDWDGIYNGVKEYADKHSKGKVDLNKNEVNWFSIYTEPIKNSKLLSNLLICTQHIRKKIDSEDELTGKIYPYYRNIKRDITFMKPSESDEYVWVAFEKGASLSVNNIMSFFNLPVTYRRKVDFNEDFIEYLNTLEKSDVNYSKIFDSDMQSVKRRADKKKHRLVESYSDLGTREGGVKEKFRSAAGVKITPSASMASVIPTIDLVITSDGWISTGVSLKDPSPSVLYSALIYGYHRIIDAFNVFQTL